MTAGMPRVAILAMPEATASVVYGMYDMFRSAGRDWGLVVEGRPGADRVAPAIVAKTTDAIDVVNGIRMTPHTSIANDTLYDVVCVPELSLSPDAPITGRFDEEIAWMRSQHARGAIIATACSGAVLLAESGLLDGHEATTHWGYCDVLERRYPTIKVQRERALVISGEGQRFVMAGGGTSWLDLALYLVARLVDVETSTQLARVNLIDWHAVGQQPFARLARTTQVDDAAVGKAQAWIAKNFAVDAPVASMVRLSGLPERTFKRRFKTATGMGPLEYVHALRIEAAKHMLETNDAPIDDVAREVGYEDATFFTRLFSRAVKLTPTQYKKRFGALKRAIRGTTR